MRVFRVSHNNVRQVGAIGIGGPASEEIRADNADAAEVAFRDHWESMGGHLVVVDLGEFCEWCGSGPECAVCGRGIVAVPFGWGSTDLPSNVVFGGEG